MNILEVKNVCKQFGENEILKNVSLNVAEGETIAIIGPSGSGKSTLLRCINNLEKIDSGNIIVDKISMIKENKNGKVMYADKKTLNNINLKLGMVFQDFNLFPHLSVLENITQSLKLVFKQTEEDANEIALKLLEKMELKDKANMYPCSLSGGQKQRVSIARALAISPKVVCMDEPTSALDPELVGEVLKVIKDLSKEKRTMIIVTHEIKFAEEVADRIIFMDDGKIVESGKPDEIMKNPKEKRTKEFLRRYINLGGENVEYIDDKYLEENELPAKEVIKFFKQISDIPRESGNEEGIKDYLVKFAKERNLECISDEWFNVIIRKKGNNKDGKFIAFQAHTDMICEKEIDSEHDFLKDSLKLIKDGDFIKADKTSLGADNGIGVALMLALLDSKQDMPNLECIFTTQEETTMIGAINIDEKNIKSKQIISLDNGKDDRMTISAANCMEWFGKINAKKQEIDVKDLQLYKLEYSGFLGGHSGGNIGDIKRGNPIKLAAEVLMNLNELYIKEILGGSRVNVIPRDLKCKFYAKENEVADLKNIINKQIRFYGEDVKITLDKISNENNNAYSNEISKNIVEFINAYENGAIEYDDENNVILSANFGAVREIEESGIRFEYSLRSNDLKLRDKYILNLKNNENKFNIDREWEQELKGFEPDYKSMLIQKVSEVYTKLFDKEIKKSIVQGVLEGGFFKDKIKDLEYICIGANTFDVHSPKEKVSITSIERTWKLLRAILKKQNV